MLGFFLEAETLILPDSVQKAQWKQIVERFTCLLYTSPSPRD